MTDTHRDRSIAELVDASIQLFRSAWRELVVVMAIAYVPWLALITLASRAGAVSLSPDADVPAFSAVGGVLMLAGFVWLTVASAGCIAVASDRYLGRPPDVGSALQRALGRAWPLIGTTLVTWLLTGIGLVLLVIPGLYFFARYAVSSTVALIETKPIGAALERATSLSQGRKLHILGTIGAAWLITFAISFTVGALFGFAGLSSLSVLAEAAVGIGIGPLIPVVTTVLYYDLRIRNEGFDVELLEQQLRADAE